MNKLFVTLVLLLTVGVASPAFAREAQDQWEISGLAGGVFPADDDQDATVYAGGRLTYNINEYVGLGVESGWMGFEQEESGLDYGDVRGIPLLANVAVVIISPLTDILLAI